MTMHLPASFTNTTQRLHIFLITFLNAILQSENNLHELCYFAEVSQAMMSSRRAFPAQIGSSGADNASILSPRDSTSGLGVKMVEYVLGGSPTAKESPAGNNDVKQEAQGQNQTQNSSANNKDNKGGSPFDVNGKKEDCCLQQNGQVNGVDDDKGFK